MDRKRAPRFLLAPLTQSNRGRWRQRHIDSRDRYFVVGKDKDCRVLYSSDDRGLDPLKQICAWVLVRVSEINRIL